MKNVKNLCLLFILSIFIFPLYLKAEIIEIDRPPLLTSIVFNEGVVSTDDYWSFSAELENINPYEVNYCYISVHANMSVPSYMRTLQIKLYYNYNSKKYEGTFVHPWSSNVEGSYRFSALYVVTKEGKHVLAEDNIFNEKFIIINNNCAAGEHEVYTDSWEDDASIENCSHNYNQIRKCRVCGQIADRRIVSSALTDWIFIKEPSTKSTGIKIKKCQRCGKIIIQEIIPKLAKGDIFIKSSSTYRIIGNNTIEYVGTSKKNVVIPNTITQGNVKYKVTSIASNAFKNNITIKKVIIGKNIKRIGKKAFFGCKNLKKITIKTTKLKIKTVGAKAFTKAGSKHYNKLVVKTTNGDSKKYRSILKGLNKKVRIS